MRQTRSGFARAPAPALRPVVAAWFAVIGVALVHGAPLTRELADGLRYVRVHVAPADLPTDEDVRQHPCILDLRYAQGDPAAASVLASWLKFHSSNRTPVFVLVNAATAPSLLAAVADGNVSGLLTIGVATHGFEPDIVVKERAADERRAYDALENGTDLVTLTTDNPDKQRNDEASLAHERPLEPLPPGDPDSALPPEAPVTKPEAPPTDAALQRAIHIYQGLRAMKVI